MNKRRHQRTPISLETVISVDGMRYKGFLANLSECGIGAYFETSSPELEFHCSPRSDIKLEFQTPSGKTIQLTCKVKWLHVHKRYDRLNSLGIEIIDPPQRYKDYYETLTMSYCPA